MDRCATPLSKTRPTVLVILDGWGVRQKHEGNAIALAKTPNYTRILKKYPNTLLSASGLSVGLPTGQEGNSEAGHLNIGAGRVVLQDAVKISKEIKDKSFFKNPAFQRALLHVKRHKSTLHLMGLLSNHQSAHVSPDHLEALLKMARSHKLKNVVLHLFTDGRDSPRFEAIELLKKMRKYIDHTKIGSIGGRYFAMDRANHWSRIEKVYNLLVMGEGPRAKTAEEAVLQAYNRNETDEFIEPTLVVADKEEPARIRSNDSVIFFNLRSDRARQLTKAIVKPDFTFFKRKAVCKNLVFVAMTDFGPDLDILSAFPSEDVKETLPIALKAFRQLYIAESEKYAHMSYFFNGGYNHAVAGEDRVVVASPEVATYDLAPAMSTHKLVGHVVGDLAECKHDFIAVNFAAPDMVAHTGNLKASIKAVEAVDAALGKLEKAVLKIKGYLLITADHGNIEGLKNQQTNEIDTEHSTCPVPFILVGTKIPRNGLKTRGKLADIAPTILQLFHVKKPKVMTGVSLIDSTYRSSV